MTASDVLVESLIDWGVDVVFGLPGDGINGFMEALRTHKDKIRYVHVRHEETAAMAACGYAKFTRKLGVCFATSGPGSVHLLNGLYDAKSDQAPVLAITGMTYHDLIGTNYLQDMNQDYLYQDVATYNQRLGPAHAKNIVDHACRAALSQKAVAHIALPIDYQAADMSQQKRYMRNVKGHTSEAFTVPKRIPERSQLEKAAHLLQGKKKIAILAGAGARGAREEVIQTADRLAAPVVKALLGKDVLPDDSPFTTGGIGVVGTRASSQVFEDRDALLVIGSSFPYIEFLPKPGQAVGIQIDDKPERIGLRYAGPEVQSAAARPLPPKSAIRNEERGAAFVAHGARCRTARFRMLRSRRLLRFRSAPLRYIDEDRRTSSISSRSRCRAQYVSHHRWMQLPRTNHARHAAPCHAFC